ncbi:MAG TPA: NPCBM/NEW2 domain-containing protein, partial [bacterium]|nr:NPCBM/NEW2 domain-containing protein [bacterium]
MDPKKLSCLFAVLLITNSSGWCVNMNDIPSAPPQDAIMAGPREIAQVRDWAGQAFGIVDPTGSGPWIEIKENSFGEVRFGRSCMGTPIRIGEQEFEHGIGTHTYSELIVHLPPNAQEFRAFVGINNNVHTQGKSGSAVFIVEADGKEIFRSPVVRGGEVPCSVAAKIPKGAQRLVLKTEATEDGEANDHTDWADVHLVLADGEKIWLDSQPDSLLGTGSLPFSFLYNGKLSQDLLGTWVHESRITEETDWIRHEVSWTDPDTRLRVQATVRCFRQYPTVDWIIQFQNTGAENSPILEDIQALDMPLRTKGSRKVTVRQ